MSNINVIENFLSEEECSHILTKCKNELKLSVAKVKLSVAKVSVGSLKYRKSSVGWIDDLGDINERVKIILRNTFNFGGMEVTGLGSFQFTEYKIGEFYRWHTDRDSSAFYNRFASTVILLNKDYEGGVLEIKNLEGEIIPITQKVGTLYIFDSNLSHQVTPVESGVRYSLVNWVSIIKTDSSLQKLI